MGMKDPVDRITAFIKELDGLTPENAAAYVEAMRKADPKGSRTLEWQALWRRWTTLDPQGCVQFISTMPEDSGHFAIDAVINKWTETNPGAAHDYIASLEGSPLYDTALYSYIGRVGTNDLDAALTIADRALKARPKEYNRSMQRLHGEFLFANQGGDSREFFKLLKSDEAKNAAFGHVLYRLMSSSADQAGDWLVEQRSFASGRAIQEVERRKNGVNPGSGTEWRNENFPEMSN